MLKLCIPTPAQQLVSALQQVQYLFLSLDDSTIELLLRSFGCLYGLVFKSALCLYVNTKRKIVCMSSVGVLNVNC